VGPPSIPASRSQGGPELSSYPHECTLQLERRTVPGETAAQIQQELQAVLDRLAAADPQFTATLTMGLVRDPFEVADDAPIVLALADACREVRGEAPTLIGKAGWADTALLAAAGVPSAYFGPAGGGAHAVEEWLDLDSLEAFTHILARTAYRFCGSAQ
jgi:acetylornithine deacetylase